MASRKSKPADLIRRRLENGIGWTLRRLILTLLMILLLLTGLSILQVATLRYLNPPATVHMVWQRAIGVTDGSVRYEWRDLEAISPHLQRAVMAAEDQRFLTHDGFDWVEIEKALDEATSGKGLRGASTITMQAARCTFLWTGRNPIRKVLEAWYTLWMELLWSKARILEMYLNTVDWGDDIVGAQAAARAYYRVDAKNLNRHQAAMLAAVLPNPHRFSPRNPTRYVVRRQHRILRDMNAMKRVNR